MKLCCWWSRKWFYPTDPTLVNVLFDYFKSNSPIKVTYQHNNLAIIYMPHQCLHPPTTTGGVGGKDQRNGHIPKMEREIQRSTVETQRQFFEWISCYSITHHHTHSCQTFCLALVYCDNFIVLWMICCDGFTFVASVLFWNRMNNVLKCKFDILKIYYQARIQNYIILRSLIWNHLKHMTMNQGITADPNGNIFLLVFHCQFRFHYL